MHVSQIGRHVYVEGQPMFDKPKDLSGPQRLHAVCREEFASSVVRTFVLRLTGNEES